MYVYLRFCFSCELVIFHFMCTCDFNNIHLFFKQGDVARWRKAEGYISAYRLHENRDDYGPWKNFRWSDFEERNKLRKTYYARHQQFSDGNDHACFGGMVKVIPSWDQNRNKKVLITRKKKPRKSKPKDVDVPNQSPTKRIYDLTTGQFKEVTSIAE